MTVPNTRDRNQRRRDTRGDQRHLAPVEPDDTPDTRAQPHDLAAEQAVLGACLMGRPDTINQVRDTLADDDWYDPKHATIWQIIVALHTAGTIPDVISVIDHALATGAQPWHRPDDDLYIQQLYRAGHLPAQAQHHASIVARHAAARHVIAAGTRMVAAGFTADRDHIAQVLDDTRGQIELAATVVDPGDDARAHREKIKLRNQASFEAERLRITRTARRLVDAEEHAATWREPRSRPTLAEELAIIDDPEQYRVDKILPMGGNVLLTAGYKTGKTTLVDNLVKAIADEKPFLGRYDIEPPGGRVGVFNYELDEKQYRQWLRDQNIDNPDRVAVLHLRGYRLPVMHEHVEDWVVQWLVEHQVQVWIVDPFARAAVGSISNENDNTEVGAFLDTLDVIKHRSGVTELILPTHTGRGEMEQGQERARGATRLNDWADVQWTVTKDEQDRRFFRAYGRDVDEAEELLSFNPADRSLSIGGWDRRGMKKRDLFNEVVEYIEENPGLGVNKIAEGVGRRKTEVSDVLRRAIAERHVFTEPGGNRSLKHYVAPHMLRGDES